jgi:two-component system, sensor histidine kinase
LVEIGRVRLMCLSIALVLTLILLTSSTLISFLSAEIEERKQTQVQLEGARESAFQASAAKSEFLAITSHEVRTPLAAIMGFASILSDTKLDANQRRYLETMNHAGERLIELLNSILDYTRIESGKLELERIPWIPAMLIHEVIETMSAQATQRGLSLHFENHLPSNLTLSGDATRIRQILLNLMSNALKFTSAGSTSVRADWTASAGKIDVGQMTMSVTDTGCGISAAQIPHLFKAFSQVDASTTRTHGGSGLGLAISKRLADMMSGSLTVRSTPGQGSIFTLTINCNVIQQTAAASTKRDQASAPSHVYAVRALVVDDQRLNRELLKVMLRRCGMEADLAAGGLEAVDLAARNPYAIIFTDIEMPDMDGFATAERIRAAELPGHRVPIVAISALTAKGTRERCIAAGMDDYITKPVYLPALHSTLAALLPQTAAISKPTANLVVGSI